MNTRNKNIVKVAVGVIAVIIVAIIMMFYVSPLASTGDGNNELITTSTTISTTGTSTTTCTAMTSTTKITTSTSTTALTTITTTSSSSVNTTLTTSENIIIDSVIEETVTEPVTNVDNTNTEPATEIILYTTYENTSLAQPSQHYDYEGAALSAGMSETDIYWLREIVSNEYGSDWVSIEEKAKIVAAVMNQVYDSRYPSTVKECLAKTCAPWGFNMYTSHYMSDSIIMAVDYYFANQSAFGNANSWYGDGTYNHFYYQ